MRTALVLVVLLAACGDDGGAKTDAGPGSDGGGSDGGGSDLCDPDPSITTPMTLAETGLCKDAACVELCPGVVEYAPQYQLYSDGAAKRRWIKLPAGMKIDTSDMNYWKFPVGTKVWKEFTTSPAEGSVRFETRLVWKLGEDESLNASFYMASYEWNAAQNATTLASPTDGVPDANGTTHDIPSRVQCRTCHNTSSKFLGLNALSLDYQSQTLDLGKLVAQDLLTNPPTAPTSAGAAYFPLPGTATEKAAFTYMHANCGHCHNAKSPTHDITPMELRLDVTKLATVTAFPGYATTVNVNTAVGTGETSGKIIDTGDHAKSVLLVRVKSTTGGTRMPQLGIEVNDQDGINTIQAWVDTLQ